MEKSIISTGKTIDAATDAALERLGLDRASVSVEVLETPRAGFFGIGATPAKIKVTYEAPDEPEEAQPAPALSSASRNVKPSQFAKLQAKKAEEARLAEAAREQAKKEAADAAAGSKPDAQPGAPEQGEARGARQPRENRNRRPRSDRPARTEAPREEEIAVPAPRPKPPAEPLPPYVTPEAGSLEAKIEEYLNGLLARMGADAKAQAVKQSEERYHVELVGEHLGMLIGRRGETLDALQHLTNYTIGRGENRHLRITVDAEDYRAKREESLEHLAYKTAAKVVRYRRNWIMEPMNAYERHVIHAALQEYDGVSTYSTGSEPNRRVVVAYGNHAAAERAEKR